MPEVAHAGEHHRQPRGIGGGDDIVITQRTPWLNDRRGPGLGNGIQSVGEREKRVGRGDGALGRTGSYSVMPCANRSPFPKAAEAVS